VGRKNIIKLTIWNDSLHQDSNDNGVRIVNLATSKNLVLKSTMVLHRNIHNCTWTSPDGKTHNQTITYWKIGDGIQVCLRYDLSGELTDTAHYLVVAKVRERLAVSKQAAH